MRSFDLQWHTACQKGSSASTSLRKRSSSSQSTSTDGFGAAKAGATGSMGGKDYPWREMSKDKKENIYFRNLERLTGTKLVK